MLELLKTLLFGEIMSALDDLKAAVQANTQVTTSAITLLNGLHSQLESIIAAGNSDAALADLAASLKTETQALSDAIVANTVAAPASVAVNTPIPAAGDGQPIVQSPADQTTSPTSGGTGAATTPA